MPERDAAVQALAAWREAVRRLDTTDRGSPEWHAAVADEEAARIAYQDAFRLALERHPHWNLDDPADGAAPSN